MIERESLEDLTKRYSSTYAYHYYYYNCHDLDGNQKQSIQLLSPLRIDDIYASLPSVRFVTVYLAKHTHTS